MSIIDIVLAETEEERDAARDALRKANAQAPTDRETIQAFLRDCTDMAGAPLTLDDQGVVVTMH